MRIRGWGEPRLLLRGAAMVSAWTGFVCFSLRPFYARFHVSLSRPWFVPGPFFFFFSFPFFVQGTPSFVTLGQTRDTISMVNNRYLGIYDAWRRWCGRVRSILFYFIFRWINRKGKLFFLWNNIDKCVSILKHTLFSNFNEIRRGERFIFW